MKHDAAGWTRKLGKYQTPSSWRASWELVVTAVPFALGWVLMHWALLNGHFWLYALLLPPTAGLLMRMFLIQHDCGHRGFFPGARTNDWAGRVIGVLTLTPYDHWRRCHAIHHTTHGNLDRRGVGDVDTLTVAEYLARSRWTRLRYRAYRHPLVMFGIGPMFVFLLTNRYPNGFLRGGWRPWTSTMGTNIAIVAAAALPVWALGLSGFLLVHAPILLLAASAGVWLFYVQHQFEKTYWSRQESWNVREGALYGSSHYDLPPVLKWFTANIGAHHVHHLSSRIPYYRLPAVLREHPELNEANRLTLRQSFKCVRAALWDEESQRLISFRDLARRERSRARQAASHVPETKLRSREC